MSQPQKISDFEARQTALDISNSYAVQAPAGSGKTELLSLRFLHLLAVCQQPEEVLAITFTKKAANEMADRILSTLDWASRVDSTEIEKQLDQDRYTAAQSVLAQDRKHGWLLQQSPNRLRIQTIDSFCNFLASRLPILSNFGGPLKISEQVDDCYRMAIQDCLQLLNDDSALSDSIAKLMLHFDNDSNKIEGLLLDLLKQREQWIEAIVDVASSPEQALYYLTENLLELVEESLNAALYHLLPVQSELIPLLRYATENLSREVNGSALLRCADLDELPDSDPGKLSIWVGLVGLLLTKDKKNPAFRKQVDKNSGFPAPSGSKQEKQLSAEKKQAMKALLGTLSQSNAALEALDYLRRLPLPDDDALSWDFLGTLTAILPTLIAQLELAFTRKNKVDYPQVSLAALRALGTDENPTDLVLSLDYQIKHILIDEFQDTSSTQMQLLHKLTAGWEANDGRTLFVVGDAMQSCYSFRNANVGLFIKLREVGLRNINIEPIDLMANFRSDAGVVSWVNSVFSNAFPGLNNISRGAVSYSESQAVHGTGLETAVSTRCYQYDENSKTEAYLEEAAFIADEISRLRTDCPESKIAILVRSRAHLEFILPALREAEIPWLANEIDRLTSLEIISDIMSLTNAICNQADRLSWLALLRAPFCGLQLQDLLIVANWNTETSILENLSQLSAESTHSDLSNDGVLRLRRIIPALANAVVRKEQYPLSRVIQSLFKELGGNKLVHSVSELDSLDRFYQLIRSAEVAGELENIAEFRHRVASSFVSSLPVGGNSNPVHVMTIHKSKGLEFDHVFLPGLARPSRADDKSLLLWHQRLNQHGEGKLFLATLSATGSADNNLYNLLQFEKSEKSRFENTRLLYIGVTRAMKSVYLSATLADKDGELSKPGSRTLLHTIWDSLLSSEEAVAGLSTIVVGSSLLASQYQQNPLLAAPKISRLPSSHFEAEQAASSLSITETAKFMDLDEKTAVELTLNNQLQIQIGNLVHEALQGYLDNPKILSAGNIPRLQHHWRKQLDSFYFSGEEIDAALTTISNSLLATINNEDINWIFDHSLEQSAAELSMQIYANGYLETHVVDRTFLDDCRQRWIIDYKSSSKPDNQPLAEFIDEQIQLYRPQLSRYSSLFADEANKGIKTALLFTSLSILVETN